MRCFLKVSHCGIFVLCELESFSPKLRAFLFYGHLKVKKCQKEIVLSSIFQKNNEENYIISKKWLNQSNYSTLLVYIEKCSYRRIQGACPDFDKSVYIIQTKGLLNFFSHFLDARAEIRGTFSFWRIEDITISF